MRSHKRPRKKRSPRQNPYFKALLTHFRSGETEEFHTGKKEVFVGRLKEVYVSGQTLPQGVKTKPGNALLTLRNEGCTMLAVPREDGKVAIVALTLHRK